MSESHTYTATVRAEVGSTATKHIRLKGLVPLTVSRPGKDSLHLAIENAQAEHLAKHLVHLGTLAVGDEKLTILKGAISRHPLKDNILHLDLLQVDAQSDIRVDVAVVPDARNCPGVKAGGIVEQRLRKVKVQCKANAIPDAIVVKLDDVSIMQTLYAKSLVMPAGVKLLTKPGLPILSIVITRGMAKADEAAAAAAAAAGGDKAAPAAAGKAAPAAAGKAAPAAAAPAKKK